MTVSLCLVEELSRVEAVAGARDAQCRCADRAVAAGEVEGVLGLDRVARSERSPTRPARRRLDGSGGGAGPLPTFRPRSCSHPTSPCGARPAHVLRADKVTCACGRQSKRRRSRVLGQDTLVSEAREHGRDVALDHGIAHAFWLRAPGCGEIRQVGLPEPGPDDVVVRTVRSGVSRGTEALVGRRGDLRGLDPRESLG